MPVPVQRSGRGLVAAALLAAFVLVLLWPGTAAAQTPTGSYVERAVQALRSDPVYVDPAAQGALDASGAAAVRSAIREAGTPIYVAVLPADAANQHGGSTDALTLELAQTLDRPGTFAVVAGRSFRAIDDQDNVNAADAANDATADNQGGSVQALLVDFADQVGAQASGEASSASAGVFAAVTLGLLVVAGGGLTLYAVRRKRRLDEQRKREFEEVKKVAYDDLDALGQDLRALDLDVSMPNADPAALEDYKKGLDQYEKATSTIDRASTVQDLRPVAEALAEGRYNMACARARLEGREIPERRSPCFFDPRHGPSVEDVMWGPYAGAERMVPVCAEDATRIKNGREPAARQIMVHNQMTPYYNAPGYYGPYAGGYFGDMAGGLMTGLLIGSLLTPGWGFGGMGYGYGGDMSGGDGGGFGDGGWGSGGDWGGGGFGGGDFGGGDF